MPPLAAQGLRVVAVVAMLGVAASLAAPPGRLPPALRGLARLLRARPDGEGCRVPAWKRSLALALVLAAALFCLV